MKEWKEILENKISSELKEQIDIFETQINLKRMGKVEDKLFAEARLRKGVMDRGMTMASVIMEMRHKN